jgi:serine/threonine-protein kinase HipA
MTKRFDREASNIKHHVQTLCAMNHLDYKQKSY